MGDSNHLARIRITVACCKIGIVAVARKLLIALGRWLEHGVLPEGAELKAAA